jgi:hypothetical protein
VEDEEKSRLIKNLKQQANSLSRAVLGDWRGVFLVVDGLCWGKFLCFCVFLVVDGLC